MKSHFNVHDFTQNGLHDVVFCRNVSDNLANSIPLQCFHSSYLNYTFKELVGFLLVCKECRIVSRSQLRYNPHFYGIISEVSSTLLVENSQVISNFPTPNRSRMYATTIWVCSCGRPTECLTLLHTRTR